MRGMEINHYQKQYEGSPQIKHRTAIIPNNPTTGQLAKRNSATISKKYLHSHVHYNTITKAWSQTKYLLIAVVDKENVITKGGGGRILFRVRKEKVVTCDIENPGIVLCERIQALQKGKSYGCYLKVKSTAAKHETVNGTGGRMWDITEILVK